MDKPFASPHAEKKTTEYADVVELGSDASAAGGGESELSAWQRSARRKPAVPGEAAAGHRNRETPVLQPEKQNMRMWWNW